MRFVIDSNSKRGPDVDRLSGRGVRGIVRFVSLRCKREVDEVRIVLIGQAAFAEKALAALHARGEQIVQVFVPPDTPGSRPDPLKTKALELGLPVSQPASFRGEREFEQFRALEAELIVMAFVTMIVPERILYAPRFKSICFHPSLLPKHRGASAINWAIIEGDAETGVTWFWPDRGIDTGPILIQRRVPIGPADTTGSLYFNSLFPLGIETMIEAIDQIKSGTAASVEQDESLATYEAPCRDEHAAIDFRRPAQAIYDLVRGCDPQPGAFATLGGRRLRLYDAILESGGKSDAPGTIVGIDQAGMRVALGDATMLVRRARFDSSAKKVAPADLAAANEIIAGARLE
jgi:methionyl-tRNA formyltransferase